jgi:hypothetical protein
MTNNKQQTEMNKEFVPYELALELKQLGFDEPCFTFYQVEYHENSPIMVDDNDQYRITGFRTCKNSEIPSHYISCPTYSQAFRWFRDKFNCHHTINLNKKYVGIAYSSVVNFSIDEFNTYEEAELECLKKLIELVKPHEGGNK